MSILNFFRRKEPRACGEFLPKDALPSLSERTLATANDEVRGVIDETLASVPKPKCRRTEQHAYSEKTRASVGKYASTHRPTAAAREFSKQLGTPSQNLPLESSGIYMSVIWRDSVSVLAVAVAVALLLLSCPYLSRAVAMHQYLVNWIVW